MSVHGGLDLRHNGGGGCVFVFFSGCWFYLPTYLPVSGTKHFFLRDDKFQADKKCYTFDNEVADVAFDD